MTLRMVYRSYGGENMKSRPPFYSKLLALASFVHAAEAADAEVTFLNDGPLPADRAALMAGRGEIISIAGGPIGLRGSYIKSLGMPADKGWPPDDLVYFCEDDYLHTADAFTRLAAAAELIPSASYFALHGDLPRSSDEFPPKWKRRPDATVEDSTWTNIPSTTSTFGGRVGAIADDMPIFKQCMRPFRRSFLDHETCLLYQGFGPYNLRGLFTGSKERRGEGVAAVAKHAVLLPFRVGMNARALTRRRQPHLLYAPDSNLACHLETEHMSPGVDWEDVARTTAIWADDTGTRST
jgi:hypothetical protein